MNKNNETPLVVLLIDDVKVAQNLSFYFREMGVVPSFFRELKTFWYSIIKDRPLLAIVDVKKMSEGHFLLKDHPLISTQSLPLAFYYSSKTRPLLTSTHDYLHYGFIEEDGPYELSLRMIFQRVLRGERTRKEIENLQEKLRLSRQKYDQLQSTLYVENKTQQTFDSLLLKIAKSFDEITNLDKFLDLLSDQLNEFSEIHEFSLVTLDKNGLKLISPEILGPKFRPIPDLKLGQTLTSGIEFFAQNMALEVALELLGDQFVPVHLYGKERNPDYMIFLKVSDKGKELFPWKLFETVVNSVYSRIVLLKQNIEREKPSEGVRPWILLSALENKENGNCFFQLDFMALLDFVRSGSENTFYWEAFYKDFINHLILDLDFQIEVIPMGIDQLVVGTEEKNMKKLNEALEIFIKQFQYQCYFEGVFSQEIAEKLGPQIWEVPNNVGEYLKLL